MKSFGSSGCPGDTVVADKGTFVPSSLAHFRDLSHTFFHLVDKQMGFLDRLLSMELLSAVGDSPWVRRILNIPFDHFGVDR